MTLKEAYKEYPMLEGLSVPTLVILRSDAIRHKDADFQAALDAILKELSNGV